MNIQYPANLAKIMKDGESMLASAEIQNPKFEIQYILSSMLGIPMLELFLAKNDRELASAEICRFNSVIKRRIAKEPLQYIFGQAHFRNLVLEVGPGVLIPRPETELLVDIVLENVADKCQICDIGTGSGAIPLTLASENQSLSLTGVDISPKALSYAEKNRKNLRLQNVSFVFSDLFSAFSKLKCRFDVITANLPYISSEEYSVLPCEIRNFEPRNALESGKDGLDTIRIFIEEAWLFMRPGAFAIIEISPGQAGPVAETIGLSCKYAEPIFHKDLNGDIRFCMFSGI